MTSTPWLGFAISRDSKTPVFEQICAAIRRAAISGELVSGSRLPATRVFATELGVSRSTVVTAYDQLVAEGYLSTRPGSGYMLCPLGEVELDQPEPTAEVPGPGRDRGVSTPVDAASGPHPFRPSEPDMRLFPHRQWAKAVARICRTRPEAMLMAGDRFGNPDLRRAIAAHVADWRGIEAEAEQVIVTAGATDALALCMQSLSTRGDLIGLEAPCYRPLRYFAQAQGLEVEDLPLDEEGARLPQGAHPPRLTVLTPSQQYPLGGAMSPNRRLDFLRWAEARDTWIIEDDYDSEFRYAGRPIPAMAGFDRLDRTIYVGSFSKIFSNALKLGYVIAPKRLLPVLRARLRLASGQASSMPQQALADFMHSGEFYRHLRRVRRIYGDRRRYLLGRMAEDFGAFGWFRDHQAGMQFVYHLNAPLKDKVLAQRAAPLGLVLHPLSDYAHDPQGPALNGLVMGFCAYTVEEMAPALDILQRCIAQELAAIA